MRPAPPIARRQFLAGSGALIVCLSLPDGGVSQTLRGSLADNPMLGGWLQINADGTVHVYSGKCELGQGITTALAQIAAEELDVSVSRIRMVSVDTQRSPDEGSTVGSNSLVHSGTALRSAAAEARGILLDAASRRLGVPIQRLTVADGTVRGAEHTARIDYWDVLGDVDLDVRMSGAAQAKPPSEYSSVGTSHPRLDLPNKFFGASAYVHDIVLPNMAHARVVRNAMAGRTLRSADTDEVRSLPGVIDVVRDGSFLAVLAEREEQAIAAAARLRESVIWSAGDGYPDEDWPAASLRLLQTNDSIVAARSADRDAPAVRQFTADYSRPFIAHASIGPSAAVALWDRRTLTVWSHAQGMYALRAALASVTQLEESAVRCIHVEGAGCYGHNGADDAACDAAMIAMAKPGTPIRLVWSRHDEFRHEPYGSAMSVRLAAATDAAERIVDWRCDIWSCSHSIRPTGTTAGNLLAARAKAAPLPRPAVSDPGPPAGGADRNAVPIYTFPTLSVSEHLVVDPPLRCSALRSLGAHANVFAIESFIDEIAQAIGADPIDYRLAHLEDERARATIEALRQLAETIASGSSDESVRRGRGFAFARYKNSSTYFAAIADVAVNIETGRIALERVLGAADSGQIVNPDGLKNQLEGGIVQAASWTTKERVRHSSSGISSIDWATYPILRFDEVPQIEIVLLNRDELPFVGAGEAAQGPTSAAIANAVAAATGVRIRDLPLTATSVLEGMRAASA